ncbi:MAG: amino acid adenylation domain-containing protein [Cytophagaceae bacterium]|nr:amino acid adenylation domain-containing protein [Cytophagaceae bacterium]MDW8455442.1 amino acid adenylation domain-containing protein [Cytophagaceae bacterium]
MNSFILSLLNKGIRIGAENGHLRVYTGNSQLSNHEKAILSEQKNALLNWLGRAKAARASWSQERIWFLDQLGFGNQYHMPAIGEIKGKLNITALEKALKYIVQRHESLRTRFTDIEGQAVQLISPDADVSLIQHDIQQHSHDEHKKNNILEEFIYRPFDLKKDMLIRALLLQTDVEQYILCINMHHIISDGWSVGVMVKDIKLAYNHYCGIEPELPAPLKMQYSGFSAWQRNYIQKSEIHEKSLNHWKEKLKGYKDLILPTDFQRPERLSGKGASVSMIFSPELGSAIISLAKALQITPFAFAVGITYTLLSRYSSQQDICMGMPVANRMSSELEELVGFFVNTVVLRLQSSEEETTESFLKKTHEVITEAQEYQQIPIEHILDVLSPRRSLSINPIFQVLISYTPSVTTDLSLGEATINPIMPESKVAKFDLTFSYTFRDDQSVWLYIEYACDLFSKETIDNYCKQLHALAQGFVNAPQICLRKQKLFCNEDLQLLLAKSKGPERKIPDVALHELFTKKAQQQPDALALCDETQQITYGQLEELSTKWAQALINKGISRGTSVAVCMESNPQTIVILWALLKAGAIYVPISPEYPEERIAYILRDSKAIALVTQTDRLKISEHINIPVIAIEQLYLTDNCELNLPKLNTTNEIACIIYTSGTTGEPKGVAITHHNIVNYVQYAIEYYRISPSDRMLQFASLCFDMSLEEIFCTMLGGATLVFADAKQKKDIHHLYKIVKTKNITLLDLPTAYWHIIAEENFSDTSLRLVIIGGEKAQASAYHSWQKINPGITIVNTYGPTEATIACLFYTLPCADSHLNEIAIGKPIANTETYILDDDLQIVPDGLPGELYIGGAGITKGYFLKETLTDMYFVNNPFGSGKLYKTGDIVRRDIHGCFFYIGRKDTQVKISGYRIECKEIEHALLQCKGIQQAAVLAKEKNNVMQLAAFYAPHDEVDETSIVNELKKKLPHYMIPAFIKALPALPLTVNGKIDYSILDSYELTLVAEEKADPPISATEKQIAAIWKELLLTENIHRTDNFFYLGGNSLLAIQMLKRVETIMHVRVPLQAIFDNQKLYELASYIDEKIPVRSLSSNESMLVQILRKEEKTALHLIFPGLPGLTEAYREMATCIPGSGAVYAFEMPGISYGEAMDSVQEIVQHYIEPIKNWSQKHSLHFYAHSFGGTVLYELLCQLMPDNVAQIVLIDAHKLVPYPLSEKHHKEFFSASFMRFMGMEESHTNGLFDVLTNQDTDNWEINVQQYVAKKINIDVEIIERIWRVVKNCLTMKYEYAKELPYPAYIVKAVANESTKSMQHWNRCFVQTHWIDAEGDHFSVIRKKYCEKWMSVISSPILAIED